MPYWSVSLGRLSRLVPQLNWQVAPQDAAMLEMAHRGPTLDVGAGGRLIEPGIITVDAVPHVGTRVVGDIAALPFRTGAVAGVICTGTLEHVPRPTSAVQEFSRVLRPGGTAHVEVPFMQPYHADPHDYWRFTDEGLALLFTGWDIEASGVHMGSGVGAAWVLREAMKDRLRQRPLARRIVHAVVSIIAQPLRLLDKPGAAGVAASGFFIRAHPPVA